MNWLLGEIINPIEEISSDVFEEEVEAHVVHDEVSEELVQVEREAKDGNEIGSVSFMVPGDMLCDDDDYEEEDEAPFASMRPQEIGGIEKFASFLISHEKESLNFNDSDEFRASKWLSLIGSESFQQPTEKVKEDLMRFEELFKSIHEVKYDILLRLG